MDLTIDRFLLYGGITLAAASALCLIIYLCFYRYSVNLLMLKLESEYGKREQHPASNRGLSGAAKKKGK